MGCYLNGVRAERRVLNVGFPRWGGAQAERGQKTPGLKPGFLVVLNGTAKAAPLQTSSSGLKPGFLLVLDGTAKAVPLQTSSSGAEARELWGSLSLLRFPRRYIPKNGTLTVWTWHRHVSYILLLPVVRP